MRSNSRQQTHCLVCWLFQFLEKLQQYKSVFVLNCGHLFLLYFPMFQFRFRVRKQYGSNDMSLQTPLLFIMAGLNDVTTWLQYFLIWTLAIQDGGFQIGQKRVCFCLFLNHYQQTRKISCFFELYGSGALF